MRRARRNEGKFWPPVRRAIWRKAQELYQEEQLAMGQDFNGLTATRQELRESGYFYRAKIIVLRQRPSSLMEESSDPALVHHPAARASDFG
jgi:hypothetical protein